jgi:hypothetical protein
MGMFLAEWVTLQVTIRTYIDLIPFAEAVSLRLDIGSFANTILKCEYIIDHQRWQSLDVRGLGQ